MGVADGTDGKATPRAAKLVLPCSRDIKEVFLAILLTPIAWLVPERHWPKLCRYLATRIIKSQPHRYALAAVRFDRTMPDAAKTIDPGEIQLDAMANRFDQRLRIFREWGPGTPSSHWVFEGRDKLLAAADAGNGMVLWYLRHGPALLSFCEALTASGVEAVQLARSNHGFADTPFAIRYLNRFWCLSEDRHMKGRIVITDENPREAMEEVRSALGHGEIVAIAVGGEANRVAKAPFFAGHMLVPTGPLKIAVDAGAPVFLLTCETLPDGTHVFEAEGPLELGEPVDGVYVFEAALEQLGAFVEKHVDRAPRQWQCWRRKDLLVDDPDPSAGEED